MAAGGRAGVDIVMFSWEALEGIAVGGGAVYASSLAAGLAKAGHRVRLFTRLGDGQSLEENIGGVLVKRCPWDRKASFLEEISCLASSFVHYFRESVRRNGPCDVIHCHEWLTIEAGLRAVETVSAGLAVGFHSTEWSRTGRWPDAGDSARIAGIERAGVERADAVISASHLVRRSLEQQFHLPDWKSEVVYHGVDLGLFDRSGGDKETARRKFGIAMSEACILFAGRFTPRSGADLAACVARDIHSRRPGTRFLFAGSGRLENDMRAAAGPGAVFASPPDRVIPPDCYRAADIVIAPFRRDMNGRAVFPAWAAGKPALSLSGTVPAEFILDGINGWVVRDGVDPVAAALLAGIDNPEKTEWMGRNGRAAAETAFTWDESVKRLLRAYERRERLTTA